MHLPGTRRIEVWDGARLVYERPENQHAAVAMADLRPSPAALAAE
jgi:hypothetical protein